MPAWLLATIYLKSSSQSVEASLTFDLLWPCSAATACVGAALDFTWPWPMTYTQKCLLLLHLNDCKLSPSLDVVFCVSHLLRYFPLDTIALVNLFFFLASVWRSEILHNTCFYHQVSKVFYRPVVPLSSGICHQSVPSYDSKTSLFGLICGALPIFSQVSALFNQELYSCFPWRTQSLGCPELPLPDEDEECSVSNSPTVH